MKRNSAAIKERKAGKRWQLCKPVLSLTSLPVNRSDLMDSAASTERKAIGNVSKLVHKESMWLPDSQAAVCEIRQSFVWFGDGIVALQETLLSPFPMALSCWSWDPSMYAAKMMTISQYIWQRGTYQIILSLSLIYSYSPSQLCNKRILPKRDKDLSSSSCLVICLSLFFELKSCGV